MSKRSFGRWSLDHLPATPKGVRLVLKVDPSESQIIIKWPSARANAAGNQKLIVVVEIDASTVSNSKINVHFYVRGTSSNFECVPTAAAITTMLVGMLYPVYDAPPMELAAARELSTLERNGGYFAAAHDRSGRYADGRIYQPDKRSITVVRGESGSGKTAFAVARLPNLISATGRNRRFCTIGHRRTAKYLTSCRRSNSPTTCSRGTRRSRCYAECGRNWRGN